MTESSNKKWFWKRKTQVNAAILALVGGIILSLFQFFFTEAMDAKGERPATTNIYTPDAETTNEPLLLGNFVSRHHRGYVGKLRTAYTLDWHDNGQVVGTYHYPSRSGVTYRLEGQLEKRKSLRLTEYTNDRKSADCELKFNSRSNAYEGTMYNTDGRRFDMKIGDISD